MEDKNLNELEIAEETLAPEEVKQEIEEETQNSAPEEEKSGWFSRFCQTIARWAKRMFFGGANASEKASILMPITATCFCTYMR